MTAYDKRFTLSLVLGAACVLVLIGAGSYDCMAHVVSPWGHLVLYWLGPILWVTAIVIWQLFAPRAGFFVVFIGTIFLFASYVYAWLGQAMACIN